MRSSLTPPMAEEKNHTYTLHGHTRHDLFHWLRNPHYPLPLQEEAILNYLQQENNYTQATLEQWAPEIQEIFEELKGRIKEDDASPPYQDGEYWYYKKFHKGAQYPIFCRKKGSLDAPEEIILDIPTLAKDHDYYQISTVSISNNHRYIAYAADTNGSERFTLFFKDLENPEIKIPPIESVVGSVIWSLNDEYVFYTPVDQDWVHDKVYRHTLMKEDENDVLIYHEKDHQFQLSLSETQDRQYILIISQGHEENEINIIPSNAPTAQPLCFRKRAPKADYSIDHWNDQWVICLSDEECPNGKLMTTTASQSLPSDHVILSHSHDLYLTDVLALSQHLIILGREKGLPVIYVMNQDYTLRKIPFQDVAYEVDLGTNALYDTPILRVHYSSFATPHSVYDIHLDGLAFTLKKIQEIPSKFNPQDYQVERHEAVSHDGEKVPVSVIYKKGLKMPAPLLLYGYGAYGFSMPVSFSSHRLSLIDRGMIYAIAHVRGGSEMGKKWYDNGKFLHKKNTFLDFIAVAQHFIQHGYTIKGKIAIWGGSAGGMLIGAALNMAPDLFGAAIADVPFVDVMTTMTDRSLPLTEPEFKEWGNPEDQQYYDYILSYSPYDNVTMQCYPPLFVHAGLNDPRVTYWEPAKWVAKLRSMKRQTQDPNMLFLKTEMGKGHSGATGRFDALQEIAQMYVFLLKALNIPFKP